MVSPNALTNATLNLARLSTSAKTWAIASSQSATRAATGAKDWVVENPKTATSVVVAPAVAVVAAPVALGAVGFTAGGVAAGE